LRSSLFRYFPDRPELEATLSAFEALLASPTNEESLQRFLAANPWILEHTFTTYWSQSLVIPKFNLGNEFQTDFLLLCWGASANPCIQLIEIEPSDSVVFTKSGDPASRLVHAMRQVVDWSNWIRKNEDFFHREVARAASKVLATVSHHGAEYEMDESSGRDWRWFWERRLDGLLPTHQLKILIGRRAQLTNQDIEKRNSFRSLNDVHFEVISYDRLLDCLKKMTEHRST
jgi:hypothetical protein